MTDEITHMEGRVMGKAGQKQGYAAAHPRGERSSKSKLTLEQVAEIRNRYADSDDSQFVLARAYGVSQRTISQIIRRLTWIDSTPQAPPPRPALRARRKSLGLTQQQLAARTGIGRGVISQIETGAVVLPTANMLVRLAAGLEVSVDRLLALLEATTE